MATQEPVTERRPSSVADEHDENRLAQFGYKQELSRDWGLAHNFGVSFSIIVRSPLSCRGRRHDGSWGWLLTCAWLMAPRGPTLHA